MASAIEFPVKSTRRMTESEVRAEALRFGVEPAADVETVRAELKAELDRRWLAESADWIVATNRWVEENGLPLEKYRLW